MNKKIASEIAIGIVLLVTIFIGGIFWMQGKKVPAPSVAATQPVAEATQSVAQPVVAGKAGTVYTNTDYGFQFAMPQAWIDNHGDYLFSIHKDKNSDVNYIEFGFRTKDEEFANDSMDGTSVAGSATAFIIDVFTIDSWNSLHSSIKGCKISITGDSGDTNGFDCRVGAQSILGQNDKYVFAFDIPKVGPDDFEFAQENLGDYPYPGMLNPVKAGFKLISQNVSQTPAQSDPL